LSLISFNSVEQKRVHTKDRVSPLCIVLGTGWIEMFYRGHTLTECKEYDLKRGTRPGDLEFWIVRFMMIPFVCIFCLGQCNPVHAASCPRK
jgi:hypothetical protein